MSDLEILNQMGILVRTSTKSADLHSVANKLLSYLEILTFKDDKWFDEITQNIVTLDSAASFEGSASEEIEAVRRAVSIAADRIGILLNGQLERLSAR